MALTVAAIVFNHDRGLPQAATVPLRYDAVQPVLLPEWQAGQRFPAVAAYAIDRLAAQAHVLVRFSATPDLPRQIELRALAQPVAGGMVPPAALVGDLAPQTVFFDALGHSAWHRYAFDTAALGAGVDCTTLQWRWQARIDAGSRWADVGLTLHRVYALLGMPSDPWLVWPADPGNVRLPRSDLLDLACLWARGARTQAEAAARITEAVNRLGGSTLFYDAQVGAPHYTVIGVPRFLCDAFLDRVRGGAGAGPLVNCSDCATIVSTFVNLLGGALWQSKMGLVGPGFRLNPILSIGAREWSTLHGGFGFHEVAWTGDCREDDLVYDACVSLDADARPGAAPHVPLLPTGLRFGRPGDGGYRDRIARREDRDECAPQPALRLRRDVAGTLQPLQARLPTKVASALRARAGPSPLPAEGYRFEGFCWYGGEFGREWLPVATVSFETALQAPAAALAGSAAPTARARTSVSTWRPLRQPNALLRIEVLETDGAASARQSLLEWAGEVASPALQPWVPGSTDEAGLALDNGGLALFTCGNLLLLVRSAGLVPLDVREVARRVDAWLVGAGAGATTAGAAGAAATAAAMAIPVWLRWREPSRLPRSAAGPGGGGTRMQLAIVTAADALACVAHAGTLESLQPLVAARARPPANAKDRR